MPSHVELTLEQLVRIAVGVPEMTHVNVAVLHSLLNVLLKKLNCQDDLVTIGGFEGKCMERILEQSKYSPLPFDVAAIVPISEQLGKVEQLEKRIADLEKNLECHFKQIRVCNQAKGKKFQSKMWEKYASPCEDLCTTCDEDNKIACSLLANVDFMKKLMRQIAGPILLQMEEVGKRLDKFYETLKEFLRQTEALFQRLEVIKQCIMEIESLRIQLQEYNMTFIGTMEELQDMLDSKLDKVHMPALKMYIRDRFDDIEMRLRMIENKETCPRAAGFINSGLCCISCGSTRVGADVGPQVVGLLPDAPARGHPSVVSKPVHCHKNLVCRSLEKEPTLMVRLKNLDLDVLASRLNRPHHGKVCKLPEANDTIYGLRNSCYSG
ncbi:GL24429 [Drosophila persimilis]|uniref:Uncharacterized protein n=2 Tax=pseudoobscura subgroup TaxID=32358 RepID=Q2M155_DROPS|nr:uncharacterized protein LOC4812870 [Drosophila pseudoobscura]XP_002022303.1 uncharacterized protein LOC6597145 [Drosophila persimilis]EDW26307.1 GL24429 [Drosophila persimilis]